MITFNYLTKFIINVAQFDNLRKLVRCFLIINKQSSRIGLSQKLFYSLSPEKDALMVCKLKLSGNVILCARFSLNANDLKRYGEPMRFRLSHENDTLCFFNYRNIYLKFRE